MLKRHPRLLVSGQMARDMLLVGTTFWLSWAWRFGALQERLQDDPVAASVGLTLVLLWPWAAVATRLYISRRMQGLLPEAWDLVRTLCATIVSLVTFQYVTHTPAFSRSTLSLWLMMCLVALLLARMTQRAVLGRLRAGGLNLRHALVVGTGAWAADVIGRIQSEPQSGVRIAGAVSLHEHDPQQHVANVPIVGSVGSLAESMQAHGIDQILVALPIEQMGAIKTLMQALSKETVDVRIVPDVFQYMTLCGSVEELFGVPMIALQATPLVGAGRVLKRCVDIFVALMVSALLSPVWLLVALAIVAEDRGPILFSQERIGLDGHLFRMWKFRTMKHVPHSAPKTGWTVADDPRRTRLGRWLRRLSIDELPQLYNVIRGDMSLVGPRPEQPSFSEVFRHEIPRYALRHKIKAGMTGWAQIHGLRGDTSIAKRIEMDLYYIEHWSLTLDLRILLRTAFGGFLSPHAY